MTIGVVIGSGTATKQTFDGRLVQVRHQILALRSLGHTVIPLNPWEHAGTEPLDVLHVVEGGFGNTVGLWGRPSAGRVVLAPFLDTNASLPLYRFLAWAGSRTRRLMTPQGVLMWQARMADAIVARSEDEVRILRHGLGVPSEKIWKVLNGVDAPDPDGPTLDEARDICAKLGLTEPFVLMLGAYQQKRKNTHRLMVSANRIGVRLVLAGNHAGGSDGARAFSALPGVTVLGSVDERTRAALYRCCQVFCLPSLYEGTGLAAMEAAVHGARVMITQRGGTRDYFGADAVYVNPFSTASIERGLRQALSTPVTPRLRDRLLKEFTWRRSAEALVSAYRGDRSAVPMPTAAG